MTDLRALYEDRHLSLTQIADRLGIAQTRVRKQLIRMGVKLRSRSEGARLRRENDHVE